LSGPRPGFCEVREAGNLMSNASGREATLLGYA